MPTRESGSCDSEDTSGQKQERGIRYDVPLVGSLSVSELQQRWTAVSELDLYRLVMWRRLPAYLCRGQNCARLNQAGEEVYDCCRGGAPHIMDKSVPELCWDFIRFDIFSVRFFERRGADALFAHHDEWDALKLREPSTQSSSPGDEQFSTITYDELFARLQLPIEDLDGLIDANVFTLLDPAPDAFPLDDRPVYRVPLQEIEEYLWSQGTQELVTAQSLVGESADPILRPSGPFVHPAPVGAPHTQANDIPESPELFVDRMRATGIKKLKDLAKLVDEKFKDSEGKPLLSDGNLGKLLPANPGTIIEWESSRSQGRRLRGKK